jgi:S-adenosylmethionine synthetase
MIEKVNPQHPDKIADRIAGAIVDLVYTKNDSPKIAVEVLIGHETGLILVETSEDISKQEVKEITKRIAGFENIEVLVVPQDLILNSNQKEKIRCGDNGIFKGVPLTNEDKELSKIARDIYITYGTDGKYILDETKLILCQSFAREEIKDKYPEAIINPLGYWTGGLNVDSGATNRKLGSDMGASVTGGGLHGKDLSKADVSINIYAFLKAQETGKEVKISCAIGDEYVDGRPYYEIVEIARQYINEVGGFEKFAEWGLF